MYLKPLAIEFSFQNARMSAHDGQHLLRFVSTGQHWFNWSVQAYSLANELVSQNRGEELTSAESILKEGFLSSSQTVRKLEVTLNKSMALSWKKLRMVFSDNPTFNSDRMINHVEYETNTNTFQYDPHEPLLFHRSCML